jgi:uncharacterized protein YndB with AHSA1/START domain
MSERVAVQLNIAVAPEKVFRALTRSDELARWFAEHADVSLSEKRYDFWGRFTLEAPDRAQGHHPILALEPDRRLKFGWRVRGAETTVEITLAPKAKDTSLALVQDGLPPRPSGQASLADFWDLSLLNLQGWLERQAVGPRCDYASGQRGDVRLSVEIDASREAVFQALIKPEELERYIAQKAIVEPRAGGRYSFGWQNDGPIKILELVPNEKLSYSWWYERPEDTIVTWALEGSGGRTRLVLVHSGFGADRLSEDFRTGWLAFLVRIKALVESGPAWQTPTATANDYTAVA